jgi:hypothetical protein
MSRPVQKQAQVDLKLSDLYTTIYSRINLKTQLESEENMRQRLLIEAPRKL